MSAKAYFKKRKSFMFHKAKIHQFSANSILKSSKGTENPSNSDSNDYNPLSPILLSLSIYGIYISKAKHLNTCSKILRFLHTAFIFVSLHYFGFNYGFDLKKETADFKVFSRATIVLCSVASYDAILYNRKKITVFISHFASDKTFPLLDAQKKKYRNLVRVSNVAVWIYAISWVASFLVLPTNKLPEVYFSEGFHRVISNSTSETFQRYLIRVTDACVCLLIEGNLSLSVVFYIVCLYGCIKWFNKIEIMLQTYPGSGVLDMLALKRLYTILTNRVENLDNAFSLCVLLWYFMVAVTVCIRVLTILGEDSNSYGFQGMVNIGLGLFRGIFVIMLIISFVSQSLMDRAGDVVFEIEKCVANSTDILTLHAYSVLLRKTEVKPVILTLWKFCTIGKPFLMTCVQTIITYVIIFLQMDSSTKNKMHT